MICEELFDGQEYGLSYWSSMCTLLCKNSLFRWIVPLVEGKIQIFLQCVSFLWVSFMLPAQPLSHRAIWQFWSPMGGCRVPIWGPTDPTSHLPQRTSDASPKARSSRLLLTHWLYSRVSNNPLFRFSELARAPHRTQGNTSLLKGMTKDTDESPGGKSRGGVLGGPCCRTFCPCGGGVHQPPSVGLSESTHVAVLQRLPQVGQSNYLF